MVDEVDVANQQREEAEATTVQAIRNAASKIPAGEPGECDGCGEYFTRTVGGYCGRCRDRAAGARRR